MAQILDFDATKKKKKIRFTILIGYNEDGEPAKVNACPDGVRPGDIFVSIRTNDISQLPDLIQRGQEKAKALL